MANVHVRAIERDGRVVFLHEVHPGRADKSYGIHVAELAALPERLIDRARTILAELETEQETPPSRVTKSSGDSQPDETNQLSLFDEDDSIRQHVLELDLLAMNPIEAMQALYTLQTTSQERVSRWESFNRCQNS